MTKPSRCPQVEELEPRTLLNAAPVPPPVLGPALVASLQGQRELDLRGTLHGGYRLLSAILVDEGEVAQLSGSGDVHGLGRVTVTGTLEVPGFIRNGTPGGELVLSNTRGTLTLQLQAPLQVGFAPLPPRYTFQIVQGTGAFQGMTGGGTIHMHFGAPSPAGAGHFTMAIR
jgi:hypothetical protein